MLDTLPVKCTLCGQENIERGNFSEHINNSCPNARVSCHCPDVRCPWIGNRSELQHHLSTCYFHPFRSTFDTIFAEQRELREQNEQLRADMHRQNTELVDRLSQGFNRHEAQINTLINQLADLIPRLKPSKEMYFSDEPISREEASHYEDCKKYYEITGEPLVSVSDDLLKEETKLTSSQLKFAIDEDYNEFTLETFLNQLCPILNIRFTDIEINKIQKGSVVLEMEIFKNVGSKCEKIRLLFKSMTDRMRKELGKLRVFFMFMGDVKSLKKKQKQRFEIKLHPEFNRTYAPGYIHWEGPINDGKDRGNQPYYCPVGWKRYSFFVTDQFDEKFRGWCICYHGTKLEHGLSILLNGLKPADIKAHGAGIYTTPSIIYASHPRYAEVKWIEKTSVVMDYFKNGQFVQFVLECRVHPSNIKKIGCETLRVCNQIVIDPNISNDKIEWLIDTKGKEIMDFNDPNSTIYCTGILIRVTDNHPGLLSTADWWYVSGTLDCIKRAPLGISYEELMKKRENKENCRVILQ